MTAYACANCRAVGVDYGPCVHQRGELDHMGQPTGWQDGQPLEPEPLEPTPCTLAYLKAWGLIP